MKIADEQLDRGDYLVISSLTKKDLNQDRDFAIKQYSELLGVVKGFRQLAEQCERTGENSLARVFYSMANRGLEVIAPKGSLPENTKISKIDLEISKKKEIIADKKRLIEKEKVENKGLWSSIVGVFWKSEIDNNILNYKQDIEKAQEEIAALEMDKLKNQVAFAMENSNVETFMQYDFSNEIVNKTTRLEKLEKIRDNFGVKRNVASGKFINSQIKEEQRRILLNSLHTDMLSGIDKINKLSAMGGEVLSSSVIGFFINIKNIFASYQYKQKNDFINALLLKQFSSISMEEILAKKDLDIAKIEKQPIRRLPPEQLISLSSDEKVLREDLFTKKSLQQRQQQKNIIELKKEQARMQKLCASASGKSESVKQFAESLGDFIGDRLERYGEQKNNQYSFWDEVGGALDDAIDVVEDYMDSEEKEENKKYNLQNSVNIQRAVAAENIIASILDLYEVFEMCNSSEIEDKELMHNLIILKNIQREILALKEEDYSIANTKRMHELFFNVTKGADLIISQIEKNSSNFEKIKQHCKLQQDVLTKIVSYDYQLTIAYDIYKKFNEDIVSILPEDRLGLVADFANSFIMKKLVNYLSGFNIILENMKMVKQHNLAIKDEISMHKSVRDKKDMPVIELLYKGEIDLNEEVYTHLDNSVLGMALVDKFKLLNFLISPKNKFKMSVKNIISKLRIGVIQDVMTNDIEPELYQQIIAYDNNLSLDFKQSIKNSRNKFLLTQDIAILSNEDLAKTMINARFKGGGEKIVANAIKQIENRIENIHNLPFQKQILFMVDNVAAIKFLEENDLSNEMITVKEKLKAVNKTIDSRINPEIYKNFSVVQLVSMHILLSKVKTNDANLAKLKNNIEQKLEETPYAGEIENILKTESINNLELFAESNDNDQNALKSIVGRVAKTTGNKYAVPAVKMLPDSVYSKSSLEYLATSSAKKVIKEKREYMINLASDMIQTILNLEKYSINLNSQEEKNIKLLLSNIYPNLFDAREIQQQTLSEIREKLIRCKSKGDLEKENRLYINKVDIEVVPKTILLQELDYEIAKLLIARERYPENLQIQNKLERLQKQRVLECRRIELSKHKNLLLEVLQSVSGKPYLSDRERNCLKQNVANVNFILSLNGLNKILYPTSILNERAVGSYYDFKGGKKKKENKKTNKISVKTKVLNNLGSRWITSGQKEANKKRYKFFANINNNVDRQTLEDLSLTKLHKKLCFFKQLDEKKRTAKIEKIKQTILKKERLFVEQGKISDYEDVAYLLSHVHENINFRKKLISFIQNKLEQSNADVFAKLSLACRIEPFLQTNEREELKINSKLTKFLQNIIEMVNKFPEYSIHQLDNLNTQITEIKNDYPKGFPPHTNYIEAINKLATVQGLIYQEIQVKEKKKFAAYDNVITKSIAMAQEEMSDILFDVILKYQHQLRPYVDSMDILVSKIMSLKNSSDIDLKYKLASEILAKGIIQRGIDELFSKHKNISEESKDFMMAISILSDKFQGIKYQLDSASELYDAYDTWNIEANDLAFDSTSENILYGAIKSTAVDLAKHAHDYIHKTRELMRNKVKNMFEFELAILNERCNSLLSAEKKQAEVVVGENLLFAAKISKKTRLKIWIDKVKNMLKQKRASFKKKFKKKMKKFSRWKNKKNKKNIEKTQKGKAVFINSKNQKTGKNNDVNRKSIINKNDNKKDKSKKINNRY